MNEHRLNVALVFFLVRLHRLFYENAINFIYWNVMLFYANELCGWAFQWHKAASRNHPTSLPPIYFWLRTDVAISKVCTSMYWYTFEVHKRLVWLAGWPVRVICKNVTLPIRQGFFFCARFGVPDRGGSGGGGGRIWGDISLNPSCNVYLKHVYLGIEYVFVFGIYVWLRAE